MEKELTAEETKIKLLKSIKNNLQFIAWYLIIGLVLAILYLTPILTK